MPPTPGLADRFFLFQESIDKPQHVGALATFRLPPDADPGYLQRLVARFRAARTFAPPFNYRLRSRAWSRIWPQYVVLEDHEVDLDFHFRHTALPRPSGERELGVHVSHLHSRALDLRKPLWEAHLIEGLGEDRFAFYFKIHHAMIDGIGGVRRLQQMLTTDPFDRGVRPVWTVGPKATPSARRSAPDLARAVKTVGGLAQAGAALLRQGLGSRRDHAIATPYKQPRSMLNGRVGQQRRVATQAIEFERARRVADAAGVTINDVFLSICAGGLRRYLDEIDALPDMGLVAGTPVSVRGDHSDNANNRFTMTVMRTYTEISDPIERLRAIHHSSTETKEALRELPQPVVENYLALVMGPYVAQNLTGLAGRLKPPYNLIISNVPGPLEPQYLAGAELEAIYPFALLFHGMALFIASLAISGKLALGFIGDRDRLPHLQRLAVYTGETFDALEAALGLASSGAPVERIRAGASSHL
jgi:diacylglycerol O-acyltransferase / wax synthase